jgi:hypothetical protein
MNPIKRGAPVDQGPVRCTWATESVAALSRSSVCSRTSPSNALTCSHLRRSPAGPHSPVAFMVAAIEFECAGTAALAGAAHKGPQEQRNSLLGRVWIEVPTSAWDSAWAAARLSASVARRRCSCCSRRKSSSSAAICSVSVRF